MAIRLSSHSLPLSFLVIFASNGYVIRFFRSLGRLVGWFVSWFRSGHAKLSLVGLSTQLCYRVECVNRGLSLRYNLGRISFSFVFHQPISSDALCVCVCVPLQPTRPRVDFFSSSSSSFLWFFFWRFSSRFRLVRRFFFIWRSRR